MENPTLDNAKLEAAAAEYAMKGAIDVIKEFYTGYESPYKKAIREKLDKDTPSIHCDIPDIIALLNESLSKEMDTIANAAIAKTYIPLVREFLTHAPAEINFSDILKEFINEYQYHIKVMGDVECEIDEDKKWGWLNIRVSYDENTYNLTLHLNDNKDDKKDGKKRYKLLSIPESEKSKSSSNYYSKTMKISLDGGATLEMPFTRDILKDRFNSYLARIVMAGSIITMDVHGFEEDMFPERCHC